MTNVEAQSRGWQGAVLKMLGADDYQFTVTGVERISDHYIRIGFTGGGLLTARPLHPTMWVRLWFQNRAGKLHQRGYTLVDADVAADTFFIEFAIHDGSAARWAEQAEPGDTIAATFMGSKFTLPEPAPKGWILVGDTASLPAINSLLDTGISAAQIFLEFQHDDDRALPVRSRENDVVHWVRRGDGIVDVLRDNKFDATGHFGWVAADTKITRTAVRVLRSDFGIDRGAIKSQAYWMANAKPS